MGLSNDLISQFVKATKTENKDKKETIVYGTVVYDGRPYVKLDGSDLLTPVSTTADVEDGERVTVMIKDHTATITGNTSSPAARTDAVKDLDNIMAYKVTTEDLAATNAMINNLRATVANIDNLSVEELEAVSAEIDNLEARYANLDHVSAKDAEIINAEIEHLEATFANITNLSTEDLEAVNADIGNLKAYNANFTYVSAEVMEAVKAYIKKLDVEKLSAASADITYANIDFANINEAAIRKIFSDTGLIKDLTVGDSTITGELVGVTIKGDLIEAGTLKADRLVVKGSDGNYYKLNTDFTATPGVEPVEEDAIHGSVLIKESITAEKISVKDLVAFGATIGGFTIEDHSLHSNGKESMTNSNPGVFLGDDGQVAFGDSNNFLKYYYDETDKKYKLEISADSLLIGANNKNIEEVVSEKISDISIGAANKIRKSADLLFENYYFTGELVVTHDGNGNVRVTCGVSVTADDRGNVTMRSATTTTHDGAGNVTTI